MSFLFYGNKEGSHGMFAYATRFKGDISKWDVSSVTNMQGMFNHAKHFNTDISKWTVSSVTTFQGMFHTAEAFNHDLNLWDVSSATSLKNMFHHAKSFSQTLCGAWATSRADKEGMFTGSRGKISSDKSKCPDSGSANSGPSVFKPSSKAQLIKAIEECLQKAHDESKPYDCPTGTNGAIGDWDVSAVTDMSFLFNGNKQGSHHHVKYSEHFNCDISKWTVSSVTTFQGMFHTAEAFNRDLNLWDVSRATSLKNMFIHAKSFSQTLCGTWATSRADKTAMFTGSNG